MTDSASLPGPLDTRLATLVSESVETDSADDANYETDGFHHRHNASPTRIVEIAGCFREHGYILEMLTCEDRRTDLEAMRLVYTFNRLGSPDRHVVFVTLAGGPGAEAPSLAAEFPAADWLEREVFDMYGVRFAEHPHLERILLPEDADFHALLKDFGRIEDAPQEGGE